MEGILNNFWWLPLISLLALAWLIWYARRRMGKAGTINKQETIWNLAILLAMAGLIYPSAMSPSDRPATFPRVLLLANVICIVVASVKIIRGAGKNEKPPNKAL